MALTYEEIQWLKDNFPVLSISEDSAKVEGSLTVHASYNRDSKKFYIGTEEHGGDYFSGTFRIQIDDQHTGVGDRKTLPSLKLIGTDFTCNAERHFYSGNQACLCGPSEVSSFAQHEYSFPKFFLELVIPFLYAQCYFDKHQVWPWPAYSHNSLGALESYSISGSIHNRDTMIATIMMLRANANEWDHIKPILNRKKPPQRWMSCVCASDKNFSECHTEAFEGLKKLHIDLRKLKIKIKL